MAPTVKAITTEDKIPEIIRPEGSVALRGSIEADRTYIKYAAMAAMGFDPDVE